MPEQKKPNLDSDNLNYFSDIFLEIETNFSKNIRSVIFYLLRQSLK